MLSVRAAGLARGPADRTEHLAGLAVICGSLAVGLLASDGRVARLVFAGSLLALVAGLGVRSPRALLVFTAGWLAVLGLSRRLLTELAPAGAADPLLLVGPLAILIVAAAAVERGAFRPWTPLSKAVAALTVLIGLGALNPAQGGLFAGMSALVFFLPIAAFWIGRGMCDDALLRRLLLLVAVLAVPAALYGLLQTFVGFPSWDERWIHENGYTALFVADAVRPFASFSSSAEYAAFLTVAIVAWVTLVRGRTLLVPRLAIVALLLVAAVYQASRGTVVVLVAALGLALGARKRLPLAASAVVAAALLALLPVAVGTAFPQTEGGGGSSELLSRQVEGLANPLDPRSSTAVAHLTLIVDGVKSAFVTPLGHGISAVTIAGSKFGSTTYQTEADPSNAAVALGLPGLAAFLVVAGLGFAGAYRLAAARRDGLALAALCVLCVLVLQWLNGGQYAVAFLPWLVLGWVDRRLVAGEGRAA